MMEYDDFILYEQVSEDMDKVKKLEYGSDAWKRAQDSIDKRYNTILSESRLSAEMAEREARIELERKKAEKEAELRKRSVSILL